MQSPEFQEFFASNKNWLEPYALFCVLRKLFGTTEHWQWGTLSTPTPEVSQFIQNRMRAFSERIAPSLVDQRGGMSVESKVCQVDGEIYQSLPKLP